jgi:hypothetical protein
MKYRDTIFVWCCSADSAKCAQDAHKAACHCKSVSHTYIFLANMLILYAVACSMLGVFNLDEKHTPGSNRSYTALSLAAAATSDGESQWSQGTGFHSIVPWKKKNQAGRVAHSSATDSSSKTVRLTPPPP